MRPADRRGPYKRVSLLGAGEAPTPTFGQQA
jgi:hypothetical protein